MSHVLTVKELANLSGWRDYDLRALARAGVLPAERHGNIWMFKASVMGRLSGLRAKRSTVLDTNIGHAADRRHKRGHADRQIG